MNYQKKDGVTGDGPGALAAHSAVRTSPSASYSAKLRDARWQKRAAQIKANALWKCEHCPSTFDLQVHHVLYLIGVEPWDHPDCLLMCLCGPCHVERQELEQTLFTNIADVIRNKTNEELREQPILSFFTEGFSLSGEGQV